MKNKAVCIMSGGMDSAVCAFIAQSMGYDIIALHFDYQQRTMDKEKQCFNALCDDLQVAQKIIIDADFIAQIGGNSLTDTTLTIRENELNHQDIPNTYVPYRNGVFLSIAAAVAQRYQANAIFIGVVYEDSSGYPDCSPDFIEKINAAVNTGTGEDLTIHAPLVHLSKREIVQKALLLNVPLEHTWSCYQNQDKPCGVCDSCLLRAKGFTLANTVDPIDL
ncbi:MAG: 7-cyano-7-deazaguanine synthase QueC [Neisseriaceae bacterium]|nr:7-cyano-7-deazaguanine synthase QueC [Neisseriaceae bacterium]